MTFSVNKILPPRPGIWYAAVLNYAKLYIFDYKLEFISNN